MALGEQFFYINNRIIDMRGLAVAATVSFYLTGTTTLQPIYDDQALATPHANPFLVNVGAAIPNIWLNPAITYRVKIVAITGEVISDLDPFDPINASTLSFIQAGTGAIPRTVQDKLRETVSITDFGAAPDASTDATAALDAAITSLGSEGGTIWFPPGTYKMNATIDQDNITLRGCGGRGEFDQAVIRPFSLASAPITISDGAGDIRYITLENLHVSGSDGTVSGQTQAAHNAPQTLLLNGGTVNFKAVNCTFYNGVQTVALVPSATNPVTVNTFILCTIRNDLTDTATARGLYVKRTAGGGDDSYATANKFAFTKVNGPSLGYAAEFDATNPGITAEINDSYWDVQPNCGILLKGSSGIVCFNLQLDPGPGGPHVIIESDQAQVSPARLINGIMRHGGQKMKFAGGVLVDLPAEADTYFYKGQFDNSFSSGPLFFTRSNAPFDTTRFIQRNAGGEIEASADVVAPTFSTATNYRVNGVVVVRAPGAPVTDPSGGSVIDVEARAALATLLSRLRAHGLIET